MTTTTEPQTKTAFERLTRYQHSASFTSDWPGLYFDANGKGRLAHTIGFLEAINAYDPDNAHELAESLVKYFDYLSGYGGMIESPANNQDHEGKTIEFPRYRVVLTDDGGIGSFGILWYHHVSHERYMHEATGLRTPIAVRSWSKPYEELDERTQGYVWDACRHDARQNLRLHPDLDLSRSFPAPYDKTAPWCREYMYYGFSHNGGLIFHFDRDDITRGHWSTHT